MCTQQCGNGGGVVGIDAGMGRDRPPRALVPTDLDHHHRLAQRGGAVERGGKALGLPDRLDEPAYDGGVRVLEEVFEERRRAHRRLVAGGDDMAEAEAAGVRQQTDAEPAAM